MAAPANGVYSSVDATVNKLLNLSEPLDVALLDSTIDTFYGAGSNDQVSKVLSSLLPTWLLASSHPIYSGFAH